MPFRRYLTDREGRDLVAAETRRTELLIGQLLGPVTQGQRTELTPMGVSDVPRQDRIRFRLLAEHADAVEAALSATARPVRLAVASRAVRYPRAVSLARLR